jgi:hypothetical protein
MKIDFLTEPQLEFGESVHFCPRKGIADFNVYDIKFRARRKEIYIGVVGTNEDVEVFIKWMEKCQSFIPAKQNSKQPNLFVSFCGFNEDSGFRSSLVFDKELSRPINNNDVKDICNIKNWDARLNQCADLYCTHIEYLTTEKNADIVICIIPKKLEPSITKQTLQPVESSIENIDLEDKNIETDFRRLLKAKAMRYGRPIQLMLRDSLEPYKEKSSRQDDATRAWNFCTALFYKTNHTPWRLIRNQNKVTTCFIGISFYRSRDKKQLHTSLAQLFDDLGNGVILRGTPVEISYDDKQPHLTEEQGNMLLKGVLREYEAIHGNLPARVVIHKTSNFNTEEIEGLSSVIQELRINNVDYITIHDGSVRLFRTGLYPPVRGTHITLDETTHLLFTRGSVEYYQTYPGLYVPRPIEIRIVESNESPTTICEEILSLTKMNWNNTQFDGKYPITIDCARRVGLIMKYIPQNTKPMTKYSFYM